MKSKTLAAAALALAIPAAASAADMPVRGYAPAPVAPAPAYVAVPAFTWTGFTFGIDMGAALSDKAKVTVPANGVAFDTRKTDGFAIGGRVGYDYQFNSFGWGGIVVGAIADISYVDVDRSSTYVDVANGTTDTVRSRLDYLGTVRGRVGLAWDRVLVYGTGGFAYGDVRYDAGVTLTGTNIPLADVSKSETATGAVYGGGVEYAIPTMRMFGGGALTLKAEYLHYDLGSTKAPIIARPGVAGFPTLAKIERSGDLFRAGVGYKF